MNQNYSILFTLFCLCVKVLSYSVDILPGGKECFIVLANEGVPVTGSFEVIHPDAKYISVNVTNSHGFIHYSQVPKKEDAEDKEDPSEGFFSFDAEVPGEHKFCISNGNDNDNDGIPRLIAFNFRASPEGEQDYQFAGLQSEIGDLKEGLELLRDHQSYMNQREDVHKETLESINTKVLCWTILEAFILVAMAIWQIMYIRSFFETKRKM